MTTSSLLVSINPNRTGHAQCVRSRFPSRQPKPSGVVALSEPSLPSRVNIEPISGSLAPTPFRFAREFWPLWSVMSFEAFFSSVLQKSIDFRGSHIPRINITQSIESNFEQIPTRRKRKICFAKFLIDTQSERVWGNIFLCVGSLGHGSKHQFDTSLERGQGLSFLALHNMNPAGFTQRKIRVSVRK